MPSSKKIIRLCADDYGLNPAVSLGIRELIGLNRLSAISCMVNFPDFPDHARALLALDRTRIRIGLHFNLTEGDSLSKPGLPLKGLKRLLLKSHLRQLNPKEIRQELEAQLACFADNFGFMPDFIDGHQHVHQFPQVRDALIAVWQTRLKSAWIRCTYPFVSPSPFRVKAAILAITGGFAFKKLLKRLSVPHNIGFAGVYDFSVQTDYGEYFRSWLRHAKTHTLIMCHPGHRADNDPIAASREAEFAYLGSEQFLKDCEHYGIFLDIDP